MAEGLRLHGAVAADPEGRTETQLVASALSQAGLRPPETLFLRYPHELSGGQRQRVLVAGALALGPELLIADEPVSSLDASIRGEILALLLRLRDELGLGVLVVTHDLGLAWNIADRIAVMYLGRIVEAGPTEEVLLAPRHPYTQALLSVVPEIRAWSRWCSPVRSRTRPGSPAGCRFHPRCPALADGSAAAAGVADHCRGTALPVLPAAEGTRAPATWSRRSSPAVTGRDRPAASVGQPPAGAAASDVRRRRGVRARARPGAVRRVVLRRTDRATWGSPSRAGWPSSTSSGSRCW